MIGAQQFKDATGRDPVMDELARCNCKRVGDLGHFYCGWCDDCQMPRFICGHPVPIAHRRSTEFTCRDCGRRVLAFGDHTGTLCSACAWVNEHVPPADQSKVRGRLGIPPSC